MTEKVCPFKPFLLSKAVVIRRRASKTNKLTICPSPPPQLQEEEEEEEDGVEDKVGLDGPSQESDTQEGNEGSQPPDILSSQLEHPNDRLQLEEGEEEEQSRQEEIRSNSNDNGVDKQDDETMESGKSQSVDQQQTHDANEQEDGLETEETAEPELQKQESSEDIFNDGNLATQKNDDGQTESNVQDSSDERKSVENLEQPPLPPPPEFEEHTG